MAKAKKKRSRHIDFRKPVVLMVTGAVLLVLATSGIVWARYHNNKTAATNSAGKQSGTSSSSSGVNLSGPTAQDKKDAETHKTDLSQQPSSNQTSDNTSGKKQVTPIITHADQNGANAYVPGIFEDGGSCTATFTKDANNITAEPTTGFHDSNHTSCPPIKLDGPLNIKGAWTVVVTYSSATAYGKSDPYTFQVP